MKATNAVTLESDSWILGAKVAAILRREIERPLLTFSGEFEETIPPTKFFLRMTHEPPFKVEHKHPTLTFEHLMLFNIVL